VAREKLSLVAATSLNDVKGLLIGVDERLDGCQVNFSTPQYVDECWFAVKPPSSSLFVALVPHRSCQQTDDLGAFLSKGPTIILRVINGGHCPRGFGAAPEPSFWLAAIPLARLPADVVTVLVERRLTDGSPERGLPEMLTVVDLRQPPGTSLELQARVREVRLALATARRDAAVRTRDEAMLRELGIHRWDDSGLGCSKSGTEHSSLISGYLMIFEPGPLATQRANLEYHSAGGRTIPCMGR